MLYLASPYSHQDEPVRVERFYAACRAAEHLMRAGRHVFSPIAHSHSIAQRGLPMGFDFWMAFDFEMMSRCDGVVVLRLDGWETSKGVAEEIAKAHERGMPVEYMDPV